METAMQELIEKFTELSKKEGDSGFVGRSVISIIKNHNYLEKEKQQIIDAVYNTYPAGEKVSKEVAEQYYNETFKTK